MNTPTRNRIACFALAVLGLVSAAAQAQNTPDAPETRARTATPQVERPADTTPGAQAPAVEAPDTDTPDVEAANDANAEEPIVWTRDRARRTSRRHGNGDGIVSIGGDSRLAEGQRTDAVVSVFGSSTSAGDVREAVVSVFGDTRVEGGSVGEAAVSVLGNVYVNAIIDGDVVAVLGNVELGPNADVRGNVVVIGGVLKRDPAAQLRGGVQHVMSMPPGALNGFKAWMDNCLRYLRPLAFASGVGWAWAIALSFLALYAVLALMLRDPVDRCVKTLQEHPGKTILASLLATVLTPVLFVVLAITIVGVAFIPVAGFGIFIATLFGKAVVLAWIGRSLMKFFDDGEKLHTAIAVLAGGAIVLLLYVVPVLGFIMFKLLGMLALGVVAYTLLLAAQARRRNAPPPAFAARGPTPMAGGQPFAAAAAPGPASMAGDGWTTGGAAQAPGAAPSSSDAGPAAGAPAGGGTQSFAGAPAGGAHAVPPGSPQAAVLDVASLPRAGFWIRMLALLIDTVIIGIGLGAISHMGQLHLVALAAYGAIMWKMKGTTVGGIICNLKVVRLDGQPVDWSTAIVRALGCFLSLVIFGLGFIWIAFDEGRQAWHDKIAGTAVVRVPQGVSLL